MTICKTSNIEVTSKFCPNCEQRFVKFSRTLRHAQVEIPIAIGTQASVVNKFVSFSKKIIKKSFDIFIFA